MKIHTGEEKHQYEEVKKTHKIILSKEEYEQWKNIWLDARGWRHELPHTTHLHKIILRGNYKWHPFNDVELEIELEGYENKDNGKIRVSKIRKD